MIIAKSMRYNGLFIINNIFSYISVKEMYSLTISNSLGKLIKPSYWLECNPCIVFLHFGKLWIFICLFNIHIHFVFSLKKFDISQKIKELQW